MMKSKIKLEELAFDSTFFVFAAFCAGFGFLWENRILLALIRCVYIPRKAKNYLPITKRIQDERGYEARNGYCGQH